MMRLRDQLTAMGGGADLAAVCEQQAIACYEANRLSYHNLTHVQHTLVTAEQLISHSHLFANQQSAIFVALWFHDIVYDPQAADNEEQSAVYARHTLGRFSFEAAWVDEVCQLILDTKSHQPATAAGEIVVDADLAILGADLDRYNLYAQAIRHEYSWVADDDYRRGRAQVLQHFLDRPHIYHTTYGRQLWEQPARQNLQIELTRLR